MASQKAMPTPSEDGIEELLLCARYGDEGDWQSMKDFVDKFGENWLSEARDDRGNTCLHMASGNGNLEIVEWILSFLPTESLSHANKSKSTPLHWAALNFQLGVLRILCPRLPPPAFNLLNGHGKTALQEAEEACEAYIVTPEDKGEVEGAEKTERGRERVRREVVVGYLLGVMGLGVRNKNASRDEKNLEDEADEMAKGVENVTLDDTAQAFTVGSAPIS